MDFQTKQILVDPKTNKAEIDATDSTHIYIVENGKVEAIPLPQYGILELACQNNRIGNLAYKMTIKR